MSECVPPVPRGPSFIFLRLFKHFSPDSYVVLTAQLATGGSAGDTGVVLPCKHHYEDARGAPAARGWRPAFVSAPLGVARLVKQGLSVVRSEGIGVILVHPTSTRYLLAAAVLARVARLPLYVYMLDLFAAARTRRLERLLGTLVERIAVRQAKAVFVMSEALESYYRHKYGVAPVLLRHPAPLPRYSNPPTEHRRQRGDGGKARIVFTGMVYEAQADALANLVVAVADMPTVEVHIYSQRSIPKLIGLGLGGWNIVHHGFVAPSAMTEIQRHADVLFLPLAFHSPYPAIIRTASPAKLPEYLAAGVPILVHAPPDAYVSWYARAFGWGLVVDRAEPKLLGQAIRRLVDDDEEVRARLIHNAWTTLQMHEEGRVAETLMQVLGVGRPCGTVGKSSGG